MTEPTRTVVDVLEFIHELDASRVPPHVTAQARRHLLDLLGVAAAGTRTRLFRIISDYACEEIGGQRDSRLLFDRRCSSTTGAALTGGMQIDSVDAHDGHRLTKGHVGCGVLPALLAGCERRAREGPGISEHDFLMALIIGYELGTRAGIALHATSREYHTSGAWVAIAAAAVVARVLGMDARSTREALGIAEYHGPRSPMMRVIDHPTMLKDGSGWGAMAGTSAALLARRGFTGAPSALIESAEVADPWSDLGERWRLSEQYLKPFPVCRWAQPAVQAALLLRKRHQLQADDIVSLSIGTFAEASRLDTREPTTTEQAQYSLPFPVAVALVHGRVDIDDIDGAGLGDETVLALSRLCTVCSVAEYDALFPAERWSDLTIVHRDGQVFESGATTAPGDPEQALSDDELDDKFYALVEPTLSARDAERLRDKVRGLGSENSIEAFERLIYLERTRER